MTNCTLVKTNLQVGFIAYKDGFKYQLFEDYKIRIAIRPVKKIIGMFYELDTDGWLLVLAGYAWDGPSGLTIDTLSSMRASLLHDVLYQMMRERQIPRKFRSYADELLRDIGYLDGMYWWRSRLWHRGVSVGAEKFADPKYKKKVIIAPKRKTVRKLKNVTGYKK